MLIVSYSDLTQLLKQHQAEITDLEHKLDSERNRQLVALRDKLSSRKDRKLKEQKRQQELDLGKEMLEQKKELDRIRMEQVCLTLVLQQSACSITFNCDQVKEAEKKAMVNGIEHNGVDQADIVIRKVNIGIAVVLIVVRQSNTACEEHHGIFFLL